MSERPRGVATAAEGRRPGPTYVGGRSAAPENSWLGAPRTQGLAAVGLATAIWGVTGVIVKSTDMPGTAITFWRVLFGIPILAAAAAIQGQLTKEGAFLPCLGAGLLFGASIVLYFVALRHTTIANVTLIGAMTPVAVALFSSKAVGERVRLRSAVFILTATAGVALAVLGAVGRPGRSGGGDLAAVGSLAFFVAYFFASKRLRASTPNSRYNLLMTVGALLPGGLALVATKAPMFGYSLYDYVLVALIALFPGSMGHWLVNWAHTRLDAATSATIQLGVPIVAILLGWVVVDEKLSAMALAGCAVALASIFATIRTQSRDGPIETGDEAEPLA